MVEDGGRKFRGMCVLERGRELESGVERCVESWGWCSPFIGAGECPRCSCRGVTTDINGRGH
jgi:hypothetical protein